jgi:sRNA-binding protein
VTLRARLLLVALAVAAAALAAARKGSPPVAVPAPAPVPRPQARATAPTPLPPVDPAGIRDVFRFVEPEPARIAPAPRATPSASPTPGPELPKLSGLVRRNGRLLAAFSVGGEVVLAGQGESAGGVEVLEVSEDGVRVRLRDGREERLRVP